MRILYSLLLSTLFCLSLNAQTIWTGDASSDWTDPGNWSSGVPTSGMTVTIPGTPNGGNFPIYSGSPVIDFTIQNAGSITFNDFVYNNGTIVNFNIGTLVNNNNYFVNAGSVVFDNDGSFTNTGTFENFGIFDNAASAVFTNAAGASLVNHGQFTNNGLLDNDGSLTNYGTVMSTDNFQNAGTFTNAGIFESPNGSVITNSAGATINVVSGGSFSHNDDFQNDGSISNDGMFITENSGTMTNDGTITSAGTLQISGMYVNNSTTNNNGITIVNNAGTLNNKNNFSNIGSIETSICGIIIQDSPIDIEATVLHDGIIYELQGNVEETILEFGVVYNDINQTKPPVPGCKGGVVLQLDENGVGTLTVADVDKGGYGNCGATLVNKTINRTDFTIADLGSQLVTLTVEDNFGLTASCDAVITVIEYTAPLEAIDDPNIEFSCPDNITVTPQPGEPFVAVDWTEPTDATTTCQDLDQCSETPNDIPGFIFLGEFNDSKYYCSNTSDWTWAAAKAEAEANGGNLAIVEDMEENNFIQSGIIADYAWIGLSDEETEGTFKWVNGEVSTFFNWNDGEPNNSGGIEDYVRLLKSNGKWTDRDASFLAEFVMEISCSNAAPSCDDISNNKPGFVFLGELNDAKYYVSDHAADWAYAKSNSEANGGHLVVINDASENSFIQNGINPSTGSVWVGLNTVNSPGVFNWINGDPVNYTNWQAGEPNGDGYDQAARMKKSTGEWTDRGIYSYSYEYVMEIPCSTSPATGSGDAVVQQISGPLNGGNFGVGITEVAYEVTDDCGNREVCIFTVTVEENPAEITAECPADVVVDAAPGASSAVVTWDDPTGTTTCYIPGVKVSQIDSFYLSGDALPVGVSYIPFNLVDSCNNFAQCLLTITVNGQVAALTLESCPGDISTDSENFTWDIPTASTTCFTGNIEIDQVDGPAMGSNPADGVYEIAYLINDECGNSEVCTFLVTVAESCPAAGTSCDDGDDCTTNDVEDGDCNCAGTYTDSDGDGVCDADDICEGGDDSVDTDGDGTPDFCDDCNFVEGDSCDDGDISTINDAYDANCNCVGEPTVLEVECQENITLIAESGETTAIVSFSTPTVTSNCIGGYNIQQTTGAQSGSPYPLGLTTVEFIVSDVCGNITSCSFDVTVIEGNCLDDDGDGVCNNDDICEGGDDNVDTDGDGIPDFCDGCNDAGQPCDDGDACTTGDAYDDACNCVGTYTDSDGDGVCDADDICEGGNDAIDTDGDGTPDFCDEPSGNPCDDVVITSNSGNITVSNVNAPIFNVFIFNSSWGTEYNCNYACTDPTSIDLAPGTYYVKVSLRDANWTEICEIFETYVVTEGCNFDAGTPCDDGDACTTGDVYDTNCNCSGTLTDSDGDGVCDAEDICPGFDDNADDDGDGIPNGCDTNECDNVTNGGAIAGDETGCAAYDPSTITVVETPSGGSGPIEYIWLSSTTDCPTQLSQTIPGATSATYNPGVITQTTYFVRCSRRTDCDDWTQGESNCVVKTVDNTDSDGDGVCDLEDVCEGGDDNMDNDGDGTPNFCDDTPDGSGDPCENVQLTVGAGSITVSNIDAPIFNIFVFNSSWGTEYNCNYNCVDPTTIDLSAGTYYVKISLRDASWDEICEVFETVVVAEGCPYEEGSSCDDGDDCTTGDVYDANCNCSGTLVDDDNDGVCNAEDLCPGFDDNADDDGDGIPNGCDTNECDNVSNGGEIAGDENGCGGYDPAPITVVSAPSGGAGNIEYLWLSATGSCPTSLTQEIPGATSATYDPGVITETTYFIRCSRRADCDDWTQGESNCIVKTVNNSDIDNDGVCDDEDICDGGDDTMDNDGDGIPNHCDDTPDGGGDPCENAIVTMGNGSITVSNLDAEIITIMIFDEQWNTVYNCGYDCVDPSTATGLDEGFYHVSIKLYDANWSPICQIMPKVYVTNTDGFISASEEVFEFQAHKNGREVRTYWVTNTESKNDYFFVERSSDGIEFQTIMDINSVTANNGAFNYFESDLDPFLGESFYRLAKVHTDGTIDYSPIRKVNFDIDLSEVAVFPNPATNEVYVDLQEFEGRSASISIFNHLGQRMDFRAIDAVGPSPVRFDLSKYTGGAYTVYINMEGTRNIARKFIVSKL